MLNTSDPVLAFDELMEEVDVKRYLLERPYGKKGRPGYNRVKMLKTILFGFMERGHAALQELDELCMSRKGNRLDNAVMENFGIRKSELLYLKEFDSLE